MGDARSTHTKFRSTACGVAAFVMTLLLRLPFTGLPFEPTDEGYYATVAEATARGARLYADQWYVRPPLLNAAYEWALRVSAVMHVPFDLTVRVASSIVAAVAVGVFAWFLAEEFEWPAVMVGSAVAALLTASMALQNEANAETWMLLPYVLSAALLMRVTARRDDAGGGGFRQALVLAAAAGALLGVAGAFKQVALVGLALPLVVWLVFEPRQVRRWVALTAAYVAGAVVVSAGIVGVLVARGDDLRAYLYFAWARNFSYIGSSHGRIDTMRVLLGRLTGSVWVLSAVGVVALAALLAGLWAGTTAGDAASRGSRIGLVALGWLLLSAVGVSASGRYYEHYFIQATIPLALLLAASLDVIWRSVPRRALRGAAVVALGLAALAVTGASWVSDVSREPAIAQGRAVYRDLGRRLPSLASAGGTFMLWGIHAGVDAYSPMRHAFRIPITAYDYGWTPTDSATFLGERFPSTAEVVDAVLARRAPDLIVLCGPLSRPAGEALAHPNDGIRLTQRLFDLVHARYTEIERGPGYVVMRRSS